MGLAAAAYLHFTAKTPLDKRYSFARVMRQDVVRSVTSSGTLQPVRVVTVGTQDSGIIQKWYVDHTEPVKEGQVLVKLNDESYRAAADASAATVKGAQTSLKLAQETFARQKALFDEGYISQQDFSVSRQQVDSAMAQLEVAKANFARDQIALNNTVIRSPVSGTVVTRVAEEGQTVAASLQAPELYRIAKDLTQMQINTSFAEADIADIKSGQKVTFTIDAFPGETFEGEIRVVRLNPTTVNSVVTYNAVVNVSNPQLRLLPGMTAYVKIELDKAPNTLAVSNAALRFKPLVSKLDAKTSNAAKDAVYVVGSDGEPKAVPVKVGLTDT